MHRECRKTCNLCGEPEVTPAPEPPPPPPLPPLPPPPEPEPSPEPEPAPAPAPSITYSDPSHGRGKTKKCHTDIRLNTDVENGTFRFLLPTPPHTIEVESSEQCRQECDKRVDCNAWSKEKPGKRCWLSKQGLPVEFQPKMNRDAGRKNCTETCHTDIHLNTDVEDGTFRFLLPTPPHTIEVESSEQCRQECDKRVDCNAWSKEKPGKRCWLSKQGRPVEFQPKMNRDAGRKDCTIESFIHR